MPERRCLDCGGPTSIMHSRCPECRRAKERRHHNRQYDDPDWRRASAAAIAAWVKVHGWVCPGFGVPAHPSRDLTAGHGVALANGGDLVQDRIIVECRSCGGRRGADRPEPSIGLTVV